MEQLGVTALTLRLRDLSGPYLSVHGSWATGFLNRSGPTGGAAYGIPCSGQVSGRRTGRSVGPEGSSIPAVFIILSVYCAGSISQPPRKQRMRPMGVDHHQVCLSLTKNWITLPVLLRAPSTSPHVVLTTKVSFLLGSPQHPDMRAVDLRITGAKRPYHRPEVREARPIISI